MSALGLAPKATAVPTRTHADAGPLGRAGVGAARVPSVGAEHRRRRRADQRLRRGCHGAGRPRVRRRGDQPPDDHHGMVDGTTLPELHAAELRHQRHRPRHHVGQRNCRRSNDAAGRAPGADRLRRHLRVNGGNWRQNVLLRSSDPVLWNGMYVGPGSTTDPFAGSPLAASNYSKQLIFNTSYLAGAKKQASIIPTSGIAVANPDGTVRQYMSFMSVRAWGTPGRWTTNYSAIAYSDDNGQNWTIAPTDPGGCRRQVGLEIRRGKPELPDGCIRQRRRWLRVQLRHTVRARRHGLPLEGRRGRDARQDAVRILDGIGLGGEQAVRRQATASQDHDDHLRHHQANGHSERQRDVGAVQRIPGQIHHDVWRFGQQHGDAHLGYTAGQLVGPDHPGHRRPVSSCTHR